MRRLRNVARSIAAVGGLMLASSVAMAAVDCSASATGVAFGAYDPLLSTNDDSTGSITVTCTYIAPGGVTVVNYTVVLSTGGNGSFAPRRMSAGASRLDYNLYRDAARTQVWGNATGGTSIISGTIRVGPGVGNGTRSNTHTVYGRIPALQDADTGNFTDSILLTLTF